MYSVDLKGNAPSKRLLEQARNFDLSRPSSVQARLSTALVTAMVLDRTPLIRCPAPQGEHLSFCPYPESSDILAASRPHGEIPVIPIKSSLVDLSRVFYPFGSNSRSGALSIPTLPPHGPKSLSPITLSQHQQAFIQEFISYNPGLASAILNLAPQLSGLSLNRR
ncbi:hypothetical protein NE237_012797 [Protea cynaroides]|uniref:Uncharacterized protein n=1 Tax=Protea cynaroides TaxID=273540 RepID=A0A9Q0JX86_9MAGN|nr:hypothetical protein NE237_012797 [Protea cynaroides]